MNNRIVLLMAIVSAFIVFAAFHVYELENIRIIGGAVTGFHFVHFSKLVYKFMKWGFRS